MVNINRVIFIFFLTLFSSVSNAGTYPRYIVQFHAGIYYPSATAACQAEIGLYVSSSYTLYQVNQENGSTWQCIYLTSGGQQTGGLAVLLSTSLTCPAGQEASYPSGTCTGALTCWNGSKVSNFSQCPVANCQSWQTAEWAYNGTNTVQYMTCVNNPCEDPNKTRNTETGICEYAPCPPINGFTAIRDNTGQCVLDPNTCDDPTGQLVRNPVTFDCEPINQTCPGQMTRDPISLQCIEPVCTGDFVNISHICTPKTQCEGEQAYNAENNSCVEPVCPSGEVNYKHYCVVKPTCGTGEIYDAGLNKCSTMKCGADEVLIGGQCEKSQSADCIAGQVYDASINRCSWPTSGTCPVGYHDTTGGCQPNEPAQNPTTTETKTDTQQTTDANGQPQTTTTTSQNNLNPDGTVSTTTTVDNGDGTPEISTQTQPQDDFCMTNPQSALCVTSSASGGSTCDAAPACSGDAVQCEILRQTWNSRCESQRTADALAAEPETIDQTPGEQEQIYKSDLASKTNADAIAIPDTDLSTNYTSNPSNYIDYTAECISTLPFTLKGQTYNLDLSVMCNIGEFARVIMRIFALWAVWYMWTRAIIKMGSPV